MTGILRIETYALKLLAELLAKPEAKQSTVATMGGEGEAGRRQLVKEIEQSLVNELAELLKLGGAELLSG